MSCARCARLMSSLTKCSRCRARFQARKARNETPVCSLNRCRKRDGDRLTDAALNDFSGSKLTAADCAASVSLSPSRFLHLFKEQTGVSFRAFRAWKRARHLLHFVNEDINLAHLAQDIGYPDSTHFSHSIRRFYGLQPRAIFSGSRDLAIYRSDPGGA